MTSLPSQNIFSYQHKYRLAQATFLCTCPEILMSYHCMLRAHAVCLLSKSEQHGQHTSSVCVQCVQLCVFPESKSNIWVWACLTGGRGLGWQTSSVGHSDLHNADSSISSEKKHKESVFGLCSGQWNNSNARSSNARDDHTTERAGQEDRKPQNLPCTMVLAHSVKSPTSTPAPAFLVACPHLYLLTDNNPITDTGEGWNFGKSVKNQQTTSNSTRRLRFWMFAPQLRPECLRYLRSDPREQSMDVRTFFLNLLQPVIPEKSCLFELLFDLFCSESLQTNPNMIVEHNTIDMLANYSNLLLLNNVKIWLLHSVAGISSLFACCEDKMSLVSFFMLIFQFCLLVVLSTESKLLSFVSI